MFLAFPDFNIYSTPLLVLVSQGIIFGSLLLVKYRKTTSISYLILALLVLITCYHRTTYTIGFMQWYDTHRDTKINYWLINFVLATGPLIFFYVKSITTSNFEFKRKDILHFLPALVYLLYRIAILIYDSNQKGFGDTQNGVLMSKWVMGPQGVFIAAFGIFQQLLYLAFSLQLYFMYRKKLRDFFSNTYTMEMNWIRNFLYIYSFLFLYSSIQVLIDVSVLELSWIQMWWYQLFSAMAVIYIGIKGYFTETDVLVNLNFNTGKIKSSSLGPTQKDLKSAATEIAVQKEKLLAYMDREKPYLEADLNLKQLAEDTNMSRAQLSEVINTGFHENFNDFVNSYRVNAFKEMLQQGKHQHLSLLGIAYECGFNSKATFNRVFKKLTNSSPTEYIKNL